MEHKISKKEMEKLIEIARKNIPAIEGKTDLEQKWSDNEDFFETAVWCLKGALIAAYELGKASAKEVSNGKI